MVSSGMSMLPIKPFWPGQNLAEQPLAVRFAVLAGILTVKIVALACYGCFLHGLSDICGAPGGDIRSFLCILGFTALPYLVLTPVALLGVRFGGLWLSLIPAAALAGLVWWFFLSIFVNFI